ncbi:MAG: putative exported membrane-associated protein [uncultured bacterium]|nr:MAG: putative exported membrane-associated protein [uncultured bacterium]OGT33142.1 MAG: hypothetical protein A3C44_06085 [Gammaproteobacteria bacterium RIFCSPHIGHO2_02_FULL_39_13]OGT49278.1 MAG: hypothetical protein A3E53_07455 [Gammaproteobacteria bacterium RIFCSPHIGHO2_12_FULL_39_24]
MKKHIFLLLIGLSGFAITGWAADAPFSTDPAASQTYVAASESINNGAALINPTTTSSNAPTANFEQQTEQQIQNLNASNQAMGTVIQTLEQNIMQLQQAITQLQTANSHATTSFNWSWLHNEDIKLSLIFVAAALVLMGMGLAVSKRLNRTSRGRTVVNHAFAKNEDDTKNEFDFMSTAEAIPAKLDLARSYMVMNDHDQAREIIKTIMEKCNNEQRNEALTLLQKMNGK